MRIVHLRKRDLAATLSDTAFKHQNPCSLRHTAVGPRSLPRDAGAGAGAAWRLPPHSEHTAERGVRGLSAAMSSFWLGFGRWLEEASCCRVRGGGIRSGMVIQLIPVPVYR